ncbi:LOW QUALITY PROTEIN: uncharacterized protein LOC117646302 [Thrips palmi]|uniref:LOW QUALITY PROTEIN: uncharacterized protein LOC117646302 n=1 Tax=Thrips palmi TaxID=161013 RepID=A0A6P8YSL6_THRPL|nr:LOW QUALITY PROTEIN: uncharacterized protein LOC117646302 [Thrips palmi]
MSKERIYSVTKADIKCCAKNCTTNEADRYFFTFPPCDVTDEKSIERCRSWVRNTGNIDLLKCKSSELAGKFYLCCHHFADWTAVYNNDGSQRYIAADAVPTIFDSQPLSKKQLKPFPVTPQSSEESDERDEPDISLDIPLPESIDCVEKDTNGDPIPEPEPDRARVAPTLDHLESIKTETDDTNVNNGDTRNSEAQVSKQNKSSSESENFQVDSSPTVKKNSVKKKKSSIEKPSSRPSRKAKQDAVNRISKQFIPAKDSEDSNPQNSPEEVDKNAQNLSKSPNGIANTNSENPPPKKLILSTSSMSPERASAKYRIVSKDVVSKLGTVVSLKPSPVVSNNFEERRKNMTVLQEPGSKSKQDQQIHLIVSPPPVSQAYLSTESMGLRSILPKPSNVSSFIDKPPITAFNLITVPRIDRNFTDSFDSVTPIARSSSTQTETKSSERFVLKILDCDSKLSVFTGLPSYDVLDKITDATLRMVIRNKTTISDIEPTMRLWIMLTCTKFMLGISTEALSVMYDLSIDECQKVVEKTSLFLRKTLSLPDCQKYVFMIPNQVLNGIADFSDSMIS